MPRTTHRGHRKEATISMNGDDLEATIRALKAAKRAEGKRQREEMEHEVTHDEAPATEAVPHEAVMAVQRVLDASNEFEVLNIPVRPATATAAVRKAYRFISLSVHPDKVGRRHPQANAAFLAVKSAMELLVNPTHQECRRVQIESATAPVAEVAVPTEEAEASEQATDTEEGREMVPMHAGGEVQPDTNAGDTVPASPIEVEVEAVEVEIDAAELIRWKYEGAREDLHGEFEAPVGSEVVDDVFGKAKLLGVRHGELLLHLGDGPQKCRTTGHVYIAPGEGEEEGETAGEEEREEEREEKREEEASSTGEPQLILYTVSKQKDGKRAMLHVFDAKNDPIQLSSRLVKRVKWAENVPTSIFGKEYDGANKACCALRGALDSTKKSLGNNGINFKVFLCVNAEGKALTIKHVLDKNELGKYLIK